MIKTGEGKKDIIIINFLSLVQQHGLSRVTLNDVAEKSGLTKSALYYYFESKEALVVEGYKLFRENFSEKFTPLVNEA